MKLYCSALLSFSFSQNYQIMKVDSKSQVKDVKGQIRKVTWRIENFSSYNNETIYSEKFIVDGIKWQISIYHNWELDELSIYLIPLGSKTFPPGWARFAQFGLAVINQTDRKTSLTAVHRHMFKEEDICFGCTDLCIWQLYNPKRGYIVNDACLVEVYISTDSTIGLISRKLIIENDLDGREITTSTSTQPHQIVDRKSEDPTEEDMKTFFSRLESEFSSLTIVYSREEAKEAVARLDEALNMSLVKFYDSGKLTSLKQEFKILASFDHSSTILTTEQKDWLSAMEEIVKELFGRTAKVVQDKNLIAAKGSNKLNITRKLDRNLIRYKEVESEVKEVEQKLAALLAERKEIFKSSKEMKLELEAMGKEWAEYEANAKVVEEEEKTVEAEWESFKGLISSIKGKI